MAKYLIQDIVPPEKRKRPKVGVTKSPATHHTVSPHVARTSAEHPVHASHRVHPSHKAHTTEMPHEVVPEPHEPSPVVMHQVENNIAHVYEPEVVTTPAPRDQSLILEHLYKDANISKQL